MTIAPYQLNQSTVERFPTSLSPRLRGEFLEETLEVFPDNYQPAQDMTAERTYDSAFAAWWHENDPVDENQVEFCHEDDVPPYDWSDVDYSDYVDDADDDDVLARIFDLEREERLTLKASTESQPAAALLPERVDVLTPTEKLRASKRRKQNLGKYRRRDYNVRTRGHYARYDLSDLEMDRYRLRKALNEAFPPSLKYWED